MKNEYYTERWWQLQAQVLAEAWWVCTDCGWPAVVAHHETYAYGIICPPRYLTALCKQCHNIRHGLTNRKPEHYRDYMRRKGWVPALTAEGGPGSLFQLGYGLGRGLPWMRV